MISLELLSALTAGFLFALACNLDTVLAAMGQGARGIPLGLRELLTAAAVNTLVTFLSLTLGALGGSFLPPGLAGKLGGLALTALGLWYLLDFLRGKGEPVQEASRGWLALSGALAVNNAGVGVAAGVTGLPPPSGLGVQFRGDGAGAASGPPFGPQVGPVEQALPAPLRGPFDRAGGMAADVRKAV